MKIKNFLKFIVSIAICLAAGYIGSLFTRPEITTWYETLNKPVFNPPDWIFGPVWTLLYILMGISFYLILRKEGHRTAKIFFVIHLVFNALWSILFFGLHQILLAFIDIVILWLIIAIMIFLFYRIKKMAAWLIVLYFLWVSFASVLNFFIWRLN